MAARRPDLDSTPPVSPRGVDVERRDAWPWRCLDCGTTIYHDGELCRACCRAPRPSYAGQPSRPTGSAGAPTGFVEWTMEQTPSQFVLKVTAVAGVELLLTAVWIRAAPLRASVLGSLLPVVG